MMTMNENKCYVHSKYKLILKYAFIIYILYILFYPSYIYLYVYIHTYIYIYMYELFCVRRQT